jgi:hypothetical protein
MGGRGAKGTHQSRPLLAFQSRIQRSRFCGCLGLSGWYRLVAILIAMAWTGGLPAPSFDVLRVANIPYASGYHSPSRALCRAAEFVCSTRKLAGFPCEPAVLPGSARAGELTPALVRRQQARGGENLSAV